MKNTGFTLIEILAVLLIIGILAAVAIISLKPNLKDAQQKDACNNLLAISAAQQIYKENNANHHYYSSINSCDSYETAIDNDLSSKLKVSISATGNTRICCQTNNNCKAFGVNNSFSNNYAQCGILVKP